MAHRKVYKHDHAIISKLTASLKLWQKSSDVGSNQGTYSTDDFAQEAINILEDRANSGDTDPFYTWLSFNVPHSPVTAPTEAELNSFRKSFR